MSTEITTKKQIPERTPRSLTGLEMLCQFISKEMPGERTIVEIGSWTGCSTILFKRYFSHVLAVDPWENTVDEISSQWDMALVEKIFDSRIVKGIEKKKMKSVEAVKLFSDCSLDAVYIDGSHKYEEVRKDIVVWFSKIKIGGFICGHDYESRFPGVVKAVRELLDVRKMKVFPDTSWAVKV